VEFYDNTVEWTTLGHNSGQRSGGSLWHDNIYKGAAIQDNVHTSLANYRQVPARPLPIWEPSDGTSIWDQNDTDGLGHYDEAKASSPHVFASGFATANGTQVGSDGTMTDNNANWVTNQWVGYSIKNTNSASSLSYKLGSRITSNDAHTIHYFYYSASDTGGKYLKFFTNDTYQIHRVLNMMDQCGSGKGNPVSGSSTAPVNSTTGKPFWTHQAVEPCFSWNNKHTSGAVLGYGVPNGQPTTKLGVDYFNLGAGFSANTTPSQVSSRYVASLNGVDYKGPFTYPHPLVSGAPAPSGTPAPPANLRVVP
jgi:hypothetical protein